MNANKPASARKLKSDLERSDAHNIEAEEYEELPELTDAMFERGTVKRAGRPIALDPRKQVTIRLRESTLAAWKASGPGWQTRMGELLSKRARKLRADMGLADFHPDDIDAMKRKGRP